MREIDSHASARLFYIAQLARAIVGQLQRRQVRTDAMRGSASARLLPNSAGRIFRFLAVYASLAAGTCAAAALERARLPGAAVCAGDRSQRVANGFAGVIPLTALALAGILNVHGVADSLRVVCAQLPSRFWNSPTPSAVWQRRPRASSAGPWRRVRSRSPNRA